MTFYNLNYKFLTILSLFFMFQNCEKALKVETSKDDNMTALIEEDRIKNFASDVNLSDEELKLEQRLFELRELFQKNIQLNKSRFYGENFYDIKEFIEATTLFEIFSFMPKGALLHTHSGGVTDIEWVINEAKQLANCYVFIKTDSPDYLYGQLQVFFNTSKIPSGFVLLNEALDENPNFAQELKNLLILNRSTLQASDDFWLEFEKRFSRIMALHNYRPLFKAYYKQAFLDLIADHVSHVEIRFIFGNLYDEQNESYPIDTMVDDLVDVVKDINETHPNFSLNLIYTSFKFLDVAAINTQIDEAFRLKQKYPKLISGFDLVAEEDRGNTIAFYNESWNRLDSLERATGLKLPLYLHAGESHSMHNTNLYDAVLLESERIGHGLNLALFPALVDEVMEKDILVEVNPLSNQILGYVSDLRNHPVRYLMNEGVQIAISSDDPGVFGYIGLSYDFFIAFVSWELDLRSIKKMVFNSITYSSITDDAQKEAAMTVLENDWNHFITNALQNF